MIKIAIVVCLATFAASEPTAEADADAYYRNYGYNWNMNNMNNWNNNWNMNNMNSGYGYNMNNWNMNNMNNMWNRYGMQQGYGNSNSYSYGKRSADAEPMMYGPWGYSMGYMNRPYHYYGYPAYHF